MADVKPLWLYFCLTGKEWRAFPHIKLGIRKLLIMELPVLYTENGLILVYFSQFLKFIITF